MIAGGTRAPERPCCGRGALGTGKTVSLGREGDLGVFLVKLGFALVKGEWL